MRKPAPGITALAEYASAFTPPMRPGRRLGTIFNTFRRFINHDKSVDRRRRSGDNLYMEGLGPKLRARARELGLSDVEVARRLGLSQSRYANYVADKREPDFSTFIKICGVLGTTPDLLLGFNAPPEASSEDDLLRQEIHAASFSMSQKGLHTLADVARALAARRESNIIPE